MGLLSGLLAKAPWQGCLPRLLAKAPWCQDPFARPLAKAASRGAAVTNRCIPLVTSAVTLLCSRAVVVLSGDVHIREAVHVLRAQHARHHLPLSAGDLNFQPTVNL